MILLRHGQSEFNLHFTRTRIDPGIPDPKLTVDGWAQAREAGRALAGQGLRRIIVSPYTRALETAHGVNEALRLPIHVSATVRERYAFACDVGRPRSVLAATWPDLDLSHIEDVWWPAEEEPKEQVVGRAALFRSEMAALPDWRDTLVISHWGFILSLTGKSITNGAWIRFDPNAPPPAELVWRP